MARAAEDLLTALTPQQAAELTAPFDIPDHQRWTYLPGPRPGLRLGDLDPEQQAIALRLLDAGYSESGARTARAIIELDRIRRLLGGRDIAEGDHNYWLRILGEVGGPEPWGWRVNGHHLAVHATVVGEAVTLTPGFFGAEPAVVRGGPHAGLRTLPDEEELARELVSRLDRDQLAVAVAGPVAPADILTRADPIADPTAIPQGLEYAAMRGDQRELLTRLVRLYVGRAPSAYADSYPTDIEHARFAWCGPTEPGAGHYYAVVGPTFLLEYDNTQDDANHIHSVWRDLRQDWGRDLLAAHYADHPHGRRSRDNPRQQGATRSGL
jgi:hypothetical protein